MLILPNKIILFASDKFPESLQGIAVKIMLILPNKIILFASDKFPESLQIFELNSEIMQIPSIFNIIICKFCFILENLNKKSNS